jgi:superfamily I DNA/RNA helicase
LEQNYRSTQTILDVAGAVVKNNLERKGKTLWTSNPRGGRVGYYQAFDAEAEARWVASKIVEHRRDEFDLRAAVLYRTNSQSRVFEEAMRRALAEALGVPASRVRLRTGARSRTKVFEVEGLGGAEAEMRLRAT